MRVIIERYHHHHQCPRGNIFLAIMYHYKVMKDFLRSYFPSHRDINALVKRQRHKYYRRHEVSSYLTPGRNESINNIFYDILCEIEII